MLILFLFIAAPLVELMLLIEVGNHISGLATIGICVATAMIGSALAKRQGMAVLNRIRHSLAYGEMPRDELIHGAMILGAGLMLFVPGFISDVLGLMLLVPGVRRVVGGLLIQRFRGRVQTFESSSVGPVPPEGDGPIFLPPGAGPKPSPKKPDVIIVD